MKQYTAYTKFYKPKGLPDLIPERRQWLRKEERSYTHYGAFYEKAHKSQHQIERQS